MPKIIPEYYLFGGFRRRRTSVDDLFKAATYTGAPRLSIFRAGMTLGATDSYHG